MTVLVQLPPSFSITRPPPSTSLSFLQRAPVSTRVRPHPSSAHSPPGLPSPWGVKAQVLPIAHKVLHDLPQPLLALPSSLSPPRSLCLRHRGLLNVPPTYQVLPEGICICCALCLLPTLVLCLISSFTWYSEMSPSLRHLPWPLLIKQQHLHHS